MEKTLECIKCALYGSTCNGHKENCKIGESRYDDEIEEKNKRTDRKRTERSK